jgi:uncharacterized membrane protein YhaH (DUF805 family)
MGWYLMAWKRSAEFSGRSRRFEYWMFMLIHAIIFLALLISVEVGASASTKAHVPELTDPLIFLCFIYGLAAAVPGLAVSVRRLHDTGKSGSWMLLAFVPVLGLLLMVFFALDGEPGGNRYGPNPKLRTPYTPTD